MEIVEKCDLCNSKDFKNIYSKPDNKFYPKEYFSVVECKNCKLGFVNPRPSFLEIKKYYPGKFYDDFETFRISYPSRYKNEYNYIKQHIASTVNKSLLDVGSADYGFPLFMKKNGWNVECVEPFGTITIDELKTYKVQLPEIPVNDPFYDVITMWAVLEHVHQPHTYFDKVAKILKPNGIFIFLVNNFASLSSKKLFLEDIPRHLFFFSQETVKRYLSNVKLDLLSVYFNNDVYSLDPANWLFYFKHKILNRKFCWENLPEEKENYFIRNKLEATNINKLKFYLKNPLFFLDRKLSPFVGFLQMLMKTYGVTIYVAGKK